MPKNKRKRKNPEPSPSIGASGPYHDDVYFMSVALLFAKKSPDRYTKVGACIVNQEGNIVGVGYNKMPDRRVDKKQPDDAFKMTNKYMCHAELNAIMNKTSVDVKGCKIYTTLFPSYECAKLIIQSGITGVVYLSNKCKGQSVSKASDIMLKTAGIEPRQFEFKDEIESLLASIDPSAE